jgi:hypothetical protein
LSSRQLSAAAENIAAAHFAMYGFDLLEQGPRARSVHGLGVANPSGMMKVTVCGSFRGFWELVDPSAGAPARTPADSHRVVDRWLDRQGKQSAFCLVQFEGADLKCMPRLYLATAAEIAAKLHAGVEQLGDTALYEQYEREDATGRHIVETLPAHWQFSEQRVAQLMATEPNPMPAAPFAGVASASGPLPQPAFA